MTRGKIHYNADRWYAYCADRMGWQVGQWINGAKVGKLCGSPEEVSPALRAQQPATNRIAADAITADGPASSPTFNGNAADAAQANTHPSRVCADAAAPTPSVWRRRK